MTKMLIIVMSAVQIIGCALMDFIRKLDFIWQCGLLGLLYGSGDLLFPSSRPELDPS